MTAEPHRNAPRIALLTCRHHDHIDHASEGKLMQALVRRGAVVTLVAWDDLLIPLKREDGVPVAMLVDANVYVIRTTWDYWDRLDQFIAFVEGMKDATLLNPRKTVLNNLNKTYLTKLEAGGVPIVPTIIVEKGKEAASIDQARSSGWSPIIIKPTVGAAAAGLKKFDRPDAAALEYLAELTRSGGALLQPFLPRVVSEGETSLVYFNGAFSHAVTKVPAQGDFRSQVDFGGVYTLVEPTEPQRHVAELTLAAWEDRYGEKPLYARVDLVPGDDGRPLLGELELIEPELFLDMDPGAADRFADAIIARVEVRHAQEGSRVESALWAIGCTALGLFGAAAFIVGVGTMISWLFGGP